MDRAVRMPGLRTLDRNFDRLPERMRWLRREAGSRPGVGRGPKPELDAELRERLAAAFRPGHRDARGDRRATASAGTLLMHAIAVAADELTASPSASPQSFASAATSRCSTARSPRASATTGRGLRRPPLATWPRDAPSRESSAAGRGRVRRSRRTRCRASGPHSAPTPRRPRARGAGTTRTSSRSASGPRRPPSSPRSSTRGSAARPSSDAGDAANVAHLDEI